LVLVCLRPGRPEMLAAKEHATALLKRKPGPRGGDHTASTKLVLGLTKGGTDRQSAQLAKRRPDLADKVWDGTASPSVI
jgi:hypothetical protein